MSVFTTAMADPPWPYKTPGGGPLQSSPTHRPQSWQNDLSGVGSTKRYGAMSMDDLMALPIASVLADDAHLYLWTTNTFIVEAHDLARAWGCKPITIITWTKIKKGKPEDEPEPSMKTGYYFRGATEHCLFCVRGSLRLQADRGLPTAFLHHRLPHSVKPDAFYDLVEEASPGPYLELFARRERAGWSGWGDEAPDSVDIFSFASNAFL